MLKRFVALIRTQLQQGTTPEGLALSVTFGVIIGIFPMIGVTTISCALLGIYFKLNQPVLQAVNYVIYPVQLLMMPVFLYIGEFLLRQPHLSLNPKELYDQFTTSPALFFQHFGMACVHAIVAWVILGPIAGFIIYKACIPMFAKLKARVPKV
jgi:uncharacterized protein (DUF2062 family)